MADLEVSDELMARVLERINEKLEAESAHAVKVADAVTKRAAAVATANAHAKASAKLVAAHASMKEREAAAKALRQALAAVDAIPEAD